MGQITFIIIIFFYVTDLFIPKFRMCVSTETNIYPFQNAIIPYQ